MLRLFEVGGADDAFRPSPYCWRTRMALAHKGLAFEAVPWRAVEKDRIAPSGGGTVPVLVDGDRWVRDSWDIAVYLEENFPDRAPLFGGEGDRAKARFLEHWTTGTVHPVIARAVLMDQFPLLAETDKAYYRDRTLRKFGTTLEEMCGDPDAAITELAGILAPLEETLDESAFLGGAAPGYGDYIVFGAFEWARVASTRRLVAEESAIAAWFARLLDAFDGFARLQPARDHWS
jgi:glutathione S-transferase